MKIDLSLSALLDMIDPLELGVVVSDIMDQINNSEDSDDIWATLNDAFEKEYQGVDVASPLSVAEDWFDGNAEDIISEAGYELNEEETCYEKIL